MEPERPRWVDKPEFDWTPETPLRLEPSAARENPADPGLESRIADARFSGPWPEPWAAASRPEPANDALPAKPAFAIHYESYWVWVTSGANHAVRSTSNWSASCDSWLERRTLRIASSLRRMGETSTGTRISA